MLWLHHWQHFPGLFEFISKDKSENAVKKKIFQCWGKPAGKLNMRFFKWQYLTDLVTYQVPLLLCLLFCCTAEPIRRKMSSCYNRNENSAFWMLAGTLCFALPLNLHRPLNNFLTFTSESKTTCYLLLLLLPSMKLKITIWSLGAVCNEIFVIFLKHSLVIKSMA